MLSAILGAKVRGWQRPARADLEPGTVVHPTGAFREAFVSPIAVVRGTCMEAGKATGDIKHLSDQHLGGRGLFLELNLQFSNLQKRIALRK